MPTDPKVNGVQQRTGAPVVSASTIGEVIVVTSGDGSLRLFQRDKDPLVFGIHEGVILSMAREPRYLLTGGEDGRFLRVSLEGEVEEIAKLRLQVGRLCGLRWGAFCVLIWKGCLCMVPGQIPTSTARAPEHGRWTRFQCRP